MLGMLLQAYWLLMQLLTCRGRDSRHHFGRLSDEGLLRLSAAPQPCTAIDKAFSAAVYPNHMHPQAAGSMRKDAMCTQTEIHQQHAQHGVAVRHSQSVMQRHAPPQVMLRSCTWKLTADLPACEQIQGPVPSALQTAAASPLAPPPVSIHSMLVRSELQARD